MAKSASVRDLYEVHTLPQPPHSAPFVQRAGSDSLGCGFSMTFFLIQGSPPVRFECCVSHRTEAKTKSTAPLTGPANTVNGGTGCSAGVTKPSAGSILGTDQGER